MKEGLEPTLVPLRTSTMEQVIIGGDLGQLTPGERMAYYRRVCQSLGLNPFTRPFQYIEIWDKKAKKTKLALYASKDATEQLRCLKGISICNLGRDTFGDVYVVTAHAIDKEGRKDSSTGAVAIQGLQGEDLANAFMRAETKAKRRVTLSLAGLGWLDESETSSIRNAALVDVDTETGELLDPAESPAERESRMLCSPTEPGEFATAGLLKARRDGLDAEAEEDLG